MKLNTRNMKRASGMTLLELTVVILVLLSLISILFIGARAWKKGSDRAGCIMNIRNIQQAARSYENMNGLALGAALNWSTGGPLIGTGAFLEVAPTCPTNKTSTYTLTATVQAVGTLYGTCTSPEAATHVPTSYTDW
jgi:type II secretory pathway pseudopilin PulG